MLNEHQYTRKHGNTLSGHSHAHDMITKNSTGADWLVALPDVRHEYVTRKCKGCAEEGLGVADPLIVEQGITDFFTDVPRLQSKSVSFVFGEVFSAIRHLGHYRRLLDCYRAGP